jgi:hypothetical protein
VGVDQGLAPVTPASLGGEVLLGTTHLRYELRNVLRNDVSYPGNVSPNAAWAEPTGCSRPRIAIRPVSGVAGGELTAPGDGRPLGKAMPFASGFAERYIACSETTAAPSS